MHTKTLNALITLAFYASLFFLTWAVLQRRFTQKNKKPTQFVYAIIILIVTVIAMQLHGHLGSKASDHIDEPVLFDHAYIHTRSAIGGWSLGHFFTYFLLGLLAPKYWYCWIAISIVWEIFEYNEYLKPQTLRDNRWQYNREWNGNPWDCMANDSGLLTGLFCRHVFDKLKTK